MAETRAGEAKKLRLELWLQGVAIHLSREGWDEPSLLCVLGRKKPHWLKRTASLSANVQDKLARDAQAVLNNPEARAHAERYIASMIVPFLGGPPASTSCESGTPPAAEAEARDRSAEAEPTAEPASPHALEFSPPRRRYKTGSSNLEARAKMDRVRSGLAIGLVRNGWPPRAIFKILGMTAGSKWLERLQSLPASEQDALVSEAGSDFRPTG